MIGVDKYAFFWDKMWVITTHGGPSRDEVGINLLAIGPQKPGAGIFYGWQLVCGSVGHLYSSLCRILLSANWPSPTCGRPAIWNLIKG